MVRRCKAAVEEAEQKLANVKKYSRVLQREIMNYKGGVQRLSTLLGSEVPVAISRLDRMAGLLEQYVAVKAAGSGPPIREASAAAFGAAGPEAPVSRPPSETPPGPTDPFFPILVGGQVAVLHTRAETGAPLTPDGEPFTGGGEKYAVLDSLDAAREYVAQKCALHPKMECLIFDARGGRIGDGTVREGASPA